MTLPSSVSVWTRRRLSALRDVPLSATPQRPRQVLLPLPTHRLRFRALPQPCRLFRALTQPPLPLPTHRLRPLCHLLRLFRVCQPPLRLPLRTRRHLFRGLCPRDNICARCGADRRSPTPCRYFDYQLNDCIPF